MLDKPLYPITTEQARRHRGVIFQPFPDIARKNLISSLDSKRPLCFTLYRFGHDVFVLRLGPFCNQKKLIIKSPINLNKKKKGLIKRGKMFLGF